MNNTSQSTRPSLDLRYLLRQPGTEIRASIYLSKPTTITISLSQKNSPIPTDHSGNSINSHFQSHSFVVFVNNTRQALPQYNATFTTQPTLQNNENPHSFDLTLKGAALPIGQHNIRIFKATEAQWNGGTPTPNYVTFHGFDVNDGEAAVVVQPPSLPVRKIEFVGDSITAGFCNTCDLKKDPLPTHTEAYGASWDYQIGEMLNATVHTAAWSGLGMVQNCCGGNTTMPSIYSRTLATLNLDDTWNFKTWIPDVLVINLGTNDGGAAVDPKKQYTNIYSELIMQASQKYGDQLQVFLACGPMSETYCTPVLNVIKNVTERGVKAHFLDQRGFLNGKFGPACCGHPSTEVDLAMAKSGAASIGTVLGWL